MVYAGIDNDIIRMHKDGMLNREISDQLGCSISTVTTRLIKAGYGRQRVDKQKVIELHEQGLYDHDIALLMNCTRSNITVILNRAGYTGRHGKIDDIDLRNRISATLTGRYTGTDNHRFKGEAIECDKHEREYYLARGMSKRISDLLKRNSEGVCGICGEKHAHLETHHIKPFIVIYREFMENVYDGNIYAFYEQFSQYPDFQDLTNLVVVCRRCHLLIHYSDNHELSPFRWESATTIESDLEEEILQA